MNILLLNRTFVYPFTGGVANSLNYISKQLDRMGIESHGCSDRAESFRPIDHVAEDGLVSKMHTVKITDSQDRTVSRLVCSEWVSVNLHDSSFIRSPGACGRHPQVLGSPAPPFRPHHRDELR